ncbi:MAG: methionyl-tRNA formyltransferase, partial [Treponema sp.]|nr:methionyl-tRNA formyltransferase [Treponema sp.]
MRIIFAGSPEIGIPSLEALVKLQLDQTGVEVAGIVTNPDTPRGRSGTPEPTEISAAALELSDKLISQGCPPIRQFKPEKLSAEARELIGSAVPDLLVSFAYGQIFGPKFLGLFPLGGINIHPSLLPKYRGAAPIPAAILNRDRETGITIQTTALEMDAGDILAQERFPLHGRETTATLSEFIARKAGEMLPAVIQGLGSGRVARIPQNHREASFCSRISKAEGRIDWTLRADEIDARIRGFTPWPLSWTMHEEHCLYVLEAAPYQAPETFKEKSASPPGAVLGMDKHAGILVQTGNGIAGITRLQYRAKKALEWRDFLIGARDFL